MHLIVPILIYVVYTIIKLAKKAQEEAQSQQHHRIPSKRPLQGDRVPPKRPSTLQEVFDYITNVETSPNRVEKKVKNPIVQPKPLENQPITAKNAKVQARPKAKRQVKIGHTKLTPNKMMEGIIMSEILAPPKSRRRRVS